MAYLVVLTTTPSLRESRRISRILLEEKLAACVTVSGPVASAYHWKGKICQSREYVLMIKTFRKLFPQVEKTIRKIHSYEIPEILALSVAAGSRAYLEWILKAVRRPSPVARRSYKKRKIF